MAKKTNNENKVYLDQLSREELLVRYQDNVQYRKELAEENKLLGELYRNAVSTAKKTSAEKKIQALQAKLVALTNPTVSEPAIIAEDPIQALPEELSA